VLQTDASPVGLGAVLELGGHVIPYASQTLTKSESNYSVIQKEFLAAVFGMKQFHHYLLGHSFTLMTDHAVFRPKDGGSSPAFGLSYARVYL